MIIKITISSIVSGLKKKKPLFFTNLLPELLSDSLLFDNLISESHSKL